MNNKKRHRYFYSTAKTVYRINLATLLLLVSRAYREVSCILLMIDISEPIVGNLGTTILILILILMISYSQGQQLWNVIEPSEWFRYSLI